ARTVVGRRYRRVLGDLPLGPDAVLDHVGRMNRGVELGQVRRLVREASADRRVRVGGVQKQEAAQVTAVVTNKVRGREGWKAIVEDADPGAKHDTAAVSRSERGKHPCRETPVVKQVLIVAS